MFFFVIYTADTTTAAIEASLRQSGLDDVQQSEVMMQVFAKEELVIAPYSARYADPGEFENYQRELDALEALENEIIR